MMAIPISPLQPFSQDYELASGTTYVVCANFIHEWRDLLFKVDTELQIFVKLLRESRLISFRRKKKEQERRNREKVVM